MESYTHTASRALVRPDAPPVALDLNDFLYQQTDARSFIDVKEWASWFDTIPVDPYIPAGYRYKSIGWFRMKHVCADAIAGIDERIATVNQLSGMTDEEGAQYLSTAPPTWQSASGYACWNLPSYVLQQSIQYNPVHGDMRRVYPRIS